MIFERFLPYGLHRTKKEVRSMLVNGDQTFCIRNEMHWEKGGKIHNIKMVQIRF